MCGIAGFVLPLCDVGFNKALRAMSKAILHRGPDGEGFFETMTFDSCYQVGLSHRRLSIIDLSTGQQPLGNEDGSIQIVFNGEIYNFLSLRDELKKKGHCFSSNSDTETIVHAYEEWGDDCVNKLRGMFAFAIWDAPRQRLFLARDRFGKKPLFLTSLNGGLLFASEIKSILAFPGVSARVNTTAIWEYFSYRYAPAPATLFDGIYKLMAGSLAIWEKGHFSEHRYYQPPDRLSLKTSVIPKDPVSLFLSKLDESVAIRMISDVPFGAFLSGGLDSSSIVSLMSRHSSCPVRTFSVGFLESTYSELGYAKVIAQQFKTDHHELIVSQDDLMQHLPRLIRFRDAPVAEPSDIPIYLLAKEARRTVKMVLTGEGSDEFLGGYSKHVFERYVRFYQMIPSFIRHGLVEPLINTLPYRFHRAKTAVITMGLESFQERMPRWFGALSRQERDILVSLRPLDNMINFTHCVTQPDNSSLRRILFFDQSSWLPDNLLERGDRMTMAASLEARMPFMDHELIELVSRLPDKYRVRGRTTKWILREAMKRLLPIEILGRAKAGFRVPINEWFRGEMRGYLYDHLIGDGSRTISFYNRSALLQVLNDHTRGRQNHEKLLWNLLNLEIWHKECIPT
jgi:asparagine synthase (glutamine-hydrolysing)